MTALVHSSHEEIERWLRARRAASAAHQRLLTELIAMLPTIAIVDATLPLLDMAIAEPEGLPAMLNAVVAPGWEGFPEALPILRDTLARAPSCRWGTTLFVLGSPRTLVGMGGFKGPPVQGVVEIGYAIAPTFQGRGLATEAARQLIARAFADTSVTTVDAHTLGHPSASTRILEKLGMRHIATTQDFEHGELWHWRILRTT